MRLLFLNQYYLPDYAATAQLLGDLCENLAARGHEVHVIASRACYDGRALKLPAYEKVGGVHVHRVGLATTRRDRFRYQFAGYLSFYGNAFLKLHMLPRPEVVTALTTPPLIGLLACWARLILGSRMVYWSMDVYPDIAARAGVLRKLPLAEGLWGLLASWQTRSADMVIALGRDMARVLSFKGVPDSRLWVLPPWSDGEEVRPLAHEENAFRQTHAQGAEQLVLYSGNMGTCHLFQEIIDAARELREESRIRFLFIGGGKQLWRLKEGLEGAPNVTFLPYQDREKLQESLSAADIHLISLDSTYDGLLVPSKLYGIMAAGRAVAFVGSEANEVARVIRDSQCGVVVPPGDGAGLAGQLRRLLLEEPGERVAMGRRGRETFLGRYDRPKALQSFERILARLNPQQAVSRDPNTDDLGSASKPALPVSRA